MEGRECQSDEGEVNLLMRIENNKIYGADMTSVFLINIRARWIDISKNEILKNNASGVHLMNVKGQNCDFS